jgi:hypothetical protein
MTQYLMIKAFGRALFVTILLIAVAAALWFYTLITIIVIVLGWLFLMFYTDPPENWD